MDKDSIIELNIIDPSVPPISSSQQRSGWGIIPKTLPSEFIIPAIFDSDPLGFDSFVISPFSSEYLNKICPEFSNEYKYNLGSVSRKHVIENFSKKSMLEKYLSFYQKTVLWKKYL